LINSKPVIRSNNTEHFRKHQIIRERLSRIKKNCETVQTVRDSQTQRENNQGIDEFLRRQTVSASSPRQRGCFGLQLSQRSD
jgi:two-component sensor histidine kinase